MSGKRIKQFRNVTRKLAKELHGEIEQSVVENYLEKSRGEEMSMLEQPNKPEDSNPLLMHNYHFRKHILFLYGKKKEFRIPENYFDFISLQKQTFTFLGYQTIFGYANGIIYYTKARDVKFEGDPEECSFNKEDPRWNPVIKKIEQYAITGRI